MKDLSSLLSLNNNNITSNSNNNPLSENYLSVSSDNYNHKDLEKVSIFEDMLLNRKSFESDFKKICLHTDIDNKISNFKIKTENSKMNSRFKINYNADNLNIKSKTNVEKREKTPTKATAVNKTPNKNPNQIKSNFSFANKLINSNVLKSSIQNKETKKN